MVGRTAAPGGAVEAVRGSGTVVSDAVVTVAPLADTCVSWPGSAATTAAPAAPAQSARPMTMASQRMGR